MSAQRLGLSLDEQRPEPLYQQIFEAITDRIKSGAFPPGFRLPPTRALAAELGAHRNTVVRAYSELTEAGFLEGTVGRGTYVRDAPERREAPSEPAMSGSLPWTALLSERSRGESLARARRITRAAGRGQYVNLARMQPAPELIPDALFRRCLDHVLRTLGGRALGYAPYEGLPRLREAIAIDLARQGVPARAEEVLITSGSQQALDLVARALVDPGDVVLTHELTYAGAVQIFGASGARLAGVPSDARGPDLAWLRSAGRAKALYLMPNHINPTGGMIERTRREELVRWSREMGVPIIEDDYAADLELDGQAPPPAMRALSGDVVYMSTYSKRLIPALRIGFILAPPSLEPHLSSLKHASDLGTSLLTQHALAEMLERGYVEAHVARMREEYRERRDALVAGLRKHLPRGVDFTVPQRGLTVWLNLPAELDPDALFEEARRRGVLVSPSTLHRVDRGGAGPRGVRLTFCWEKPARLVEGAKRLGEAIDALSSTRSRAHARGEAMSVV